MRCVGHGMIRQSWVSTACRALIGALQNIKGLGGMGEFFIFFNSVLFVTLLNFIQQLLMMQNLKYSVKIINMDQDEMEYLIRC